MPIRWATDQNRHGMSVQSTIALTEGRSERVLMVKNTTSAHSCKIYIPEPVVGVHQEENNSRLATVGHF